jgi:hypothetical protein
MELSLEYLQGLRENLFHLSFFSEKIFRYGVLAWRLRPLHKKITSGILSFMSAATFSKQQIPFYTLSKYVPN